MAAKALVNNVPYDFACLNLTLRDLLTIGLRSIDFEHGMETEKLMGASREALDRTEGTYNAEDVEVTMYESDYLRLITAIGPGYMLESASFPGALGYGYDGQPAITTEFQRLRIVKDAHGYQQGPEGLEVSLTLSCMKIKPGGIDPVKK